jgi:hypothetical protein
MIIKIGILTINSVIVILVLLCTYYFFREGSHLYLRSTKHYGENKYKIDNNGQILRTEKSGMCLTNMYN